MFSTDEERKQWEKEQKMYREESKQNFFLKVKENLQDALLSLSSKLSEAEGYENTLFANDAVRGFAFIELCHKRYDVILMNPPFGEGSENTVDYLDNHYPAWCSNLVCSFFDRMQELLVSGGLVGSIFDRTVLIKSSYENFRKRNICGYIKYCADTGWNVLDASVETSTLVLSKNAFSGDGIFINVLDTPASDKHQAIFDAIQNVSDSPAIQLRNSQDFTKLPNSIIGYYFDKDILKIFQNLNLEQRGLVARQGHAFVSSMHYRNFYELNSTIKFKHMYNGAPFTMFYATCRETVFWGNDGESVKVHPSFRNSSGAYQLQSGVGYGKRGDIVDAHILKSQSFFTVEGLAIPAIRQDESFALLGYINSIVGQNSINQYTAQHKHAGYMNLLPMPDYAQRQKEIDRIVTEIIDIKRWWFSLDETNLEYRGLLAQINAKESIADALVSLQDKLTADYDRYQELVKENDDLWMDLADIESDSEFRKTLNDYKSRRPYEELISIDGGSSENIINQQTFAKEIVMELVGMAFGRWTMTGVTFGTVPEFNGIFDALPFMPKVALNTSELLEYYIPLPMNGLLFGGAKHNNSIVKRVQLVMQKLWNNKADDIEYELCQMIGCESLEDYFANMGAGGFFDYHFKRYTKSRRKAPIYWPISSQSGDTVVWCYYPRLSEQTIPAVLLMLSSERNTLQGELNGAMGTGDRKLENKLRTAISEIESLEIELTRVNNLPYKPCHDDGVPVTAAPLLNCFRHVAWKNECAENWNKLDSGEYDWSHLSYSIYPERIRTKVKKDWCLALTHGLEELCDNKPKEKKTRKKKTTQIEAQFDFGED